MKFSNKQNRAIDDNGKEYWISRSIAISVVLFFFSKEDQTWYMPVIKRGEKLEESGKYCLPCGYLDRDETAAEAMRREVWEEIGLDLSDLMWRYSWHGNIQQPFHVDSSPRAHRQNVTLEYFLAFEVDELPKLSLEQADKEEIADVTRLKIEKAIKIDMAFDHEVIIRERWEFIKNTSNLFT